jgi:hypothetical protein
MTKSQNLVIRYFSLVSSMRDRIDFFKLNIYLEHLVIYLKNQSYNDLEEWRQMMMMMKIIY